MCSTFQISRHDSQTSFLPRVSLSQLKRCHLKHEILPLTCVLETETQCVRWKGGVALFLGPGCDVWRCLQVLCPKEAKHFFTRRLWRLEENVHYYRVCAWGAHEVTCLSLFVCFSQATEIGSQNATVSALWRNVVFHDCHTGLSFWAFAAKASFIFQRRGLL